jgi:hypothetical protein
MTDAELRALVRDAVARHLGGRVGAAATPDVVGPAAPAGHGPAERAGEGAWRDHASHAVYLALANPSDQCVIEPHVACTHCQYCQSHGH